MVINGLNLPSIGLIRAKPLAVGSGYMLAIYPPGPGCLAGAGAATVMEMEVSDAELTRIVDVAPHLVAKRNHKRK